MTRPKKTPVEAFGPELLQVLLKAARGEKIVLNFPKRRDAKKFQLRLYSLRNRMKEENHPQWKIAARATTSLKWEEGGTADTPATLYIMQADSQFNDVLKKARISGVEEGIAAPELDEDPLNQI